MYQFTINLIKASLLLFFMVVIVNCGGGETELTNNTNTQSQTTTETPSEATPQPSGPSPTTPPASGTGTASLSWYPPTTYEDGSTLTDLAGHHIYMDSGNGFIRVGTVTNPSLSNYLIENLAPGTYYFAVTAYDSNGIESSFSNQAAIIISS